MKFISQLRPFLFGATAQKYWLAAGLILAIAGQSLIREPQPLTAFKAISEFSTNLNKSLYLELKNPANIMVGLFLIMLAALIYGRLLVSASEAGNETKSCISDEAWLPWKKFLPWGLVNLGIYALVMTQLAHHQYSNKLLWIWLATTLIFTILFWKNEQKTQPNPDSSITSLDGIWMLALFAFAVAAGSYLLNDLPAGWIPDEGAFWITARQIAFGEIKPAFFDFGVYSFPVSSNILQGWIMRWAGVNMWGWRFASVLPAALTTIPLYLLARELFDRRTAIAANMMMIVNPYFLSFARLGYNNSQVLFPVTLCIYFLVLGFRRNSRFYLWLAGLTAGLGFYTYFAAWLGLAVIITIASLPLLRGKKSSKNIAPLVVIIAGALTMLLPRVLYGISSDTPISLHFKFWETIPINAFYAQSIFGEERIAQAKFFMLNDQFRLFYDPALYGIIFLRGLIRSVGVLFDPIVNFDHHIIFGLTGPGSSIFFILGLGATLANFKKTQYLIPSIWFLAGFFFLGVFTSFPPRPTHLVAIIPAMSLISAIGLVSFLDAIISINPEKPASALRWKKLGTAGILLIIAIISFIQFFFLTLYIYFPPEKTEYTSWLERQIPASANFVIIDNPAARSPMDEIQLDLAQHKSTTLTQADLEADPSQLKAWKNFIAFVDLSGGKELAEWIANRIPASSVQAAYVPGQRLRGYVVTDMQINASMDISLSHGMKDLWNSPARNILLFCGIGIIALFVKQKQQKVEHRIK
jgi:4-amino-4-deoxy-L-arabinose transferase-like glycosyltransferase